ncbi:MAG: hypothetical protein IJW19_04030, partial [Clostridia bacterium]|nr:hypothetical protein [Clostridia bacterium]
RIVINYHLGALGSIYSLLYGENFVKNNTQLFYPRVPVRGAKKKRPSTMVFFFLTFPAMVKISLALPFTATDKVLVPLGSDPSEAR